ncbi:MAG: DUF1540 domain-containing protein [Clostridia bacterium]|nr:DUF1540 domain-containing protein [Clostridia bacterium]
MFDLKCKRQDCKFNHNCDCTAKNVKVGKDTDCETYVPTKSNAKEEDKILQPAMRKNICVACDANCLFNKKHICKANSISVMTNDGSPECCTFMPE